MTTEFQLNVLKYILQRREGSNYLDLLPSTFFDSDEYRLAFDIIKQYKKLYMAMPSRVNLVEYLDIVRRTSRTELSSERLSEFSLLIGSLYIPLPEDTNILREAVVRYAQIQKTKALFKDYGVKLFDESESNASFFDDMLSDVRKIVDLARAGEKREIFSITRDYKRRNLVQNAGYPTKIPFMNSCQSAGGFVPGELVIVLAPPKNGKTTFMMNLAAGYGADGYKVLYIDTENGMQRLKQMAYQTISLVTSGTIYRNSDYFNSVLDKVMLRYKALGGDLRLACLPPKVSTMADVEAIIQQVIEEDGYVPQIVFIDYLDNLKSMYPVQDERKGIQAVYMDCKRMAMNEDRPYVVFSPSQINRIGASKARFTSKDIAEDYAKVGNADSVWGYLRDTTNKADNTALLFPLDNRNGKDYGEIILYHDPNIYLIEELEVVDSVWEKRDIFLKEAQDIEEAY